MNRKSWGGNFTWAGADTQDSSVLATARLQGKDPISVLFPRLTSPTPRLANLILPGVDEEQWRQIPRARSAGPARPCPVAEKAAGPPRDHNAGSLIRSGSWSTSAPPPHQRRSWTWTETFHSAIGHFEGDELVAHHSSGRDPETLEMLAEVVSNNPMGEAGGR